MKVPLNDSKEAFPPLMVAARTIESIGFPGRFFAPTAVDSLPSSVRTQLCTTFDKYVLIFALLS